MGKRWIKNFVKEKIQYYEKFLQENPEYQFRSQMKKGIKDLKELL